MDNHILLSIAGIGVLGIVCQWFAWWVRIPSILFLLTAGCLVTVQAAPKPAETLDLWPGVAPGEKGVIPSEVLRPPKPNDKKKF